MKRFLISVSLLGHFITNAATYYSQGSLDPSQLSSWGTLFSGGTAPLSFTTTGDIFVIQNGHSMTTTTIWTIGASGSKLQIQNGGTLTGNYGILFRGIFQIDNGGTYIHNNSESVAQGAGLSIFSGTESFGINSNFEIRDWSDYIVGLPNSAPGITWGNLIINLQVDLGGTWSWNIANNGVVTIAGNLDIRSTYIGATQRELRMVGNVAMATINIGGSLLISGSTTYVAIKKNGSPPLDGIATMQVDGDISIGNNATLEITGSTASSGAGSKLLFKGNFSNSGVVTTNGVSSTINDFELNGTSNQNISSTGTLSGSRLLFIMNNPAGSTLNSPLTLPGNLSLQSGTIKTTAINIFKMIRNATYSTDPSNISFIDGPMEKTGDEDFVFPVGKGGIYAPITMNTISNAGMNDVFTAEYIRGNPQSAIGSGYDASSNFDHISYVEYWRLTQDIGDAVKSVAITVNAASFCKDLDNTFVSRYQPGTGWVNEGRQVLGIPSASGPYAIATLRIGLANTISEFGYFTLATDQTFAINPLPIKLVSFNSTKISNRQALLNWELAECCVADAKFQLERAGSDHRFTPIAAISGNETNHFYSVYDNDLKTGVNYYRLKITDIDGTVTYSRVVAVMNGIKDIFLNLSPTIISSQAQLTISSAVPQSLDLFVVDMTGKILQQIHQKIQSGNNTIPLSLSHLHNGAYLIYGVTAEGRTNPIQFIKQ